MRKYKMLVQKYLAGWVRGTREAKAFTQEEMSEQLRMSARAYSDLEHEKSGLSAATLMFYLAVLSEEDILRLIAQFQEEFRQTEENEEAP